VEADDAGLDAIFLPVVQAEAFGNELLPPIRVLWRRRIRVVLFQRDDVRVGLQELGVDAGRRGVQIASDAVVPRRWRLFPTDCSTL